MAEIGVMTETMMDFLDCFSDAYVRLLDPAINLFSHLLQFELLGFAFLLSQGKIDLTGAVKKLFFTGFLFMVIRDWPSIQSQLMESAIWLGLTAAGKEDVVTLLDPSMIVGSGFTKAKPLFDWVRNMSIRNVVFSLDTILLCYISGFLVIIAFGYLAWQVFTTFLDFYCVSVKFGMLMAFRVLGPTKWASQGAMQMPFQYAAKLFAMSFVFAISESIMEEKYFKLDVDTITWHDAGGIVLAAWVSTLLCARIGSLAGSYVSGTPSLGAADIAAIGGAAGATMVGTVMATGAGVKAGGAVARSALKTSSGAATGARMGQMGASSITGKVVGAGAGAIKGAASASPVGGFVKSVSSGFKEAVQQGRISGYTATGGSLGPKASTSGYDKKGFKAAYKAAKTFKHAQSAAADSHHNFSGGGKPKDS